MPDSTGGIGDVSRQATGLSQSLQDTLRLLQNNKQGTDEFNAALDKLLKTHKQYDEVLKKETNAKKILATITASLTEADKRYAESVKALEKEITGSVVPYSKAVTAAQEYRDSLKRIQDQLKESGKSSPVINAGLAKSESELFNIRWKGQRQVAESLMAEGKYVQALGAGFRSLAPEGVTSLLSTLVDIGAIGARFAGIISGLATAVLGAMFMFKEAADSAIAASKAGIQFNSTMDAMASGSEFYMEALKESASMGFLVSTADLMKQVSDLNKEYGFGLVATADAYERVLAGDRSLEKRLVMSELAMVGTLNRIGWAFGMTKEESIKTAAQIQTSSHIMGKEVPGTFSYLLTEAQRMKIPLQGLLQVFTALGEASHNTGVSSLELLNQMKGMEQAVRALKGGPGFFNMDPRTVQEGMLSLTETFKGMNVFRMAVMSQQRGESPWRALMESAMLPEKRGPLAAARMGEFMPGITKEGMEDFWVKTKSGERMKSLDEMTDKNVDMLTRVGVLMTDGRFTPDMYKQAQLVMSYVRQRGFSALPEIMDKVKGDEVENRLKQNRTVGQILQSGSDVFGVILIAVQELVKYVFQILNILIGIRGGGLLDLIGGSSDTKTPVIQPLGPSGDRPQPRRRPPRLP